MKTEVKLDRVTVVGSILLSPNDLSKALRDIGWTVGLSNDELMFVLVRTTGDVEENKAVILKNKYQATWRLDTSNHLNSEEKKKVVMALLLFKHKHLSRIDIAFDFINGASAGMKHRLLKPKVSTTEIWSDINNAQMIFSVGGKLETIYAGKRKSLSLFRYYDKLCEQKKAGNKIPADVKNWERLELQLRGSRTEEWLSRAKEMLQWFKLPTYQKLDGTQYFILRGIIEDPSNWQRLSPNTKAKYRKLIKNNKGFDVSYSKKAFEVLEENVNQLNDEINNFLVDLKKDMQRVDCKKDCEISTENE